MKMRKKKNLSAVHCLEMEKAVSPKRPSRAVQILVGRCDCFMEDESHLSSCKVSAPSYINCSSLIILDNMAAMREAAAPHVVVFPSPGVGHFNPLAEFARKLDLHHHLHVTLFATAMDPGPPQATQQSIIDSLPPTLTTISLPPINPSNPIPPQFEHFKYLYQIILGVDQGMRRLSTFLKIECATIPLMVLVVDMFGVEAALDLAKELKNVEVYLFHTANFTVLSFFLSLPDTDRRFAGPFRDMPEPLRLPGCVPIPGSDFPQITEDRQSEGYERALVAVKRYKEAVGIFVNSAAELELGAMEALKQDVTVPPIAPVGPLTQPSDKVGKSEYCMKWLDQQPGGSVIFVSFGSVGLLSMAQTTELALGLEMSGQRFLWAVKKPSDSDDDNPALFLPEGFTSRTEGVGLVLPWWAPQVEILANKATGAFLSHCGWNSMVESMVHGVPIVAWPLEFEQRTNAVLAVDGMKVAMRARMGECRLVGREEICRVVVEMMVGEEGKMVRERMGEFQDMALRAVEKDGSSSKALAVVVNKWRSQCLGH